MSGSLTLAKSLKSCTSRDKLLLDYYELICIALYSSFRVVVSGQHATEIRRSIVD